jgi:hypothetical protein
MLGSSGQAGRIMSRLVGSSEDEARQALRLHNWAGDQNQLLVASNVLLGRTMKIKYRLITEAIEAQQ